MGHKVRLSQKFIHTGLNRIVVITGCGQTVLAVGTVTPEATDDLTGKLVHSLCGLGIHQLKICSVDRAADGILAVLALVDHDTAAVHLKDVPVLCLHPCRNGLAPVILRAGNLDEIVWLISLLANQSILIYNLKHKDKPKDLLTAEEVELLTVPSDLAEYKTAITEALYKGTKRNIESENDPKNAVVE